MLESNFNKIFDPFTYLNAEDEKCSIEVVPQISLKTYSLGNKLIIKKYICTTEFTSSRRFIQVFNASTILPYFERCVLYKKLENWSKLENCVIIVLITLVRIWVHILIFRFEENSGSSDFTTFLEVFLMEHYRWPLARN